ncbi:MAG: FAD-dependent oxidoreductase [Desulfobulbaceae bacterium]|nr:FAD-dependent oxidoreductase [Desulfobulbaceae bacterium]
MTHHLIIGNGVAGTTAAESIRQKDNSCDITIITEEDLPFYFRIRLPEYLSGDVTEERLLAQKPEWYNDQRINLMSRCRVIGVDPMTKTVTTSTKQTLTYDRLLIATGSHSFVPPIQGANTPGVFTLRNISDARSIKEHAATANKVVVIGGGLLGLETGQALRKIGKEVTVVEFFPRLLPRQLDDQGASRLKEMMETKLGFSFRLDAQTKEIIGHERVTGIALKDGETLPCEMVIISAGVRPNLDLAVSMGLTHDKGIVVNERMETSIKDVFAAGDVAEFGGQPPTGIWPTAMQHGKVAGIVKAYGTAIYSGTIMANRLKVAGIDLAAIGDIDADQRHESRITVTDTTYRKIVIDQNQIIGCILLGDTRDYGKLNRAITDKTELHLLDRELSESL